MNNVEINKLKMRCECGGKLWAMGVSRYECEACSKMYKKYGQEINKAD